MKPRPFGNLLVSPEEGSELAGREGERRRERKGLPETPPPSQGSRVTVPSQQGWGLLVGDTCVSTEGRTGWLRLG